MEETVAKPAFSGLKPNNIIKVNVSSQEDFFKQWCIYLKPIIKLTNREIDIAATFLKIREEYSKKINDPALVDKLVMNEETRRRVMKECGITSQYFCVVMSKLKENKIIVDGHIHPRLIPNVRSTDNGMFQLVILFKTDESNI